MSGFTPGPWDVSKIGTVFKNGVLHPLRPDETRKDGESWIDMRHRIQPQLDAREAECEANARLIAAAPDLLSALEWAVNSQPEDADSWVTEARAAIAKAKGGAE